MGILDDVTPAQREAVTHIDGPLLVVAGAGSGKTRVITKRIAYLIEQGIPPWKILAITFTNKAANEMRERVEAMGVGRGVWLSTFHSMCVRMLRRSPELIGRTSSFVIYDASDQSACVKAIVKRLELDSKQFTPDRLRNAISRAKNEFLTPEQFGQRVGDYFDETVAKVYRRYAETLAANNALDFDDLLMFTAQLLEQDEGFREHWQERFHYILIDEYQDTNRPQYLIAKHLAAARRNLCATGDPDQSIYGWRGADLRNILDFQKDYPDATVVKLEENFRSTQIILDSASAVIANNTERIDRALFTQKVGGELIGLLHCGDEQEEAYAVATAIQERVNAGRGYGDFAIFYRTNAQSRAIETGLRMLGVPYAMVGAVEFYNRKEVKDVLAYLRLIANPRDSLAAVRIVNVPARGIGATSVARMVRWAEENDASFLDAIAHADETGIRGKSLTSAKQFGELFKTLAELPGTPVADLVREAITLIGYEAALLTSKDPRAEERIENIHELATAAAEYDSDRPDGCLQEFLENVALVSDTDALPDHAQQVTLMTIHSAKGLEFPVVFLTGMEEGLLPHQNALRDETNGVEEERRLCYVAITRAQEELIITLAGIRGRFGQYEDAIPSRFLQEIPPHLLSSSVADLDFDDDDDDDDDLRIEYEYDELPPAEPASQVEEPLGRGDYVQHRKFGRGRVMAVSGHGPNATIRVSFAQGEKTLVQKYARLERVY